MRRLINDNRINEMIYTENNTKGLEILNTRQSVGSLSEMDQFGHDEMRRFWMYSRTIQESTISGKEPFPGEIHQKSSYILAKFASEDDSIDIYPGQIQFFFVHEISTNRINMENHYLAYVRWYKKIKNRFYFGINQEQMCNVELWDTEFYPKSRDCIIPVHHILGRFVPVKYKISDRKNAKEYLAVNPINRKYNLR
ncbi:hypothetical protein Glove_166g166 [Diversispora epigaea]|uniref:Uncharacterized protein n=1 Tax=Diversispora epigaea TaxID=1348612 RepID=A0A397ITA3_9GLOM|nr:hypothetical protein Glove_166g166 [Diversispora epigaea]